MQCSAAQLLEGEVFLWRKYMPGCSCEEDHQKDMYLSSYDDVVEQIKAATPTLADHDVRMQAAQLFRPRYRQDRVSETREAANLPEYEVGHFTVIGGDIKFLEYGKTLEEMHQSQIRQRSNEYSREEHQTSRLIQEAFRNGATVVTTVYPRAGDDHRDILVMRYDRNTRIGVASIITAMAGQDGSLDAIHRVARNRFSNLPESKPSDRVFILSDTTVSTRRGEEVLLEVQQTVREVNDIKPTEQRGFWRREAANIFESKMREKNRDRSTDERPALHREESPSHLEIRAKSINEKPDQIAVEEYWAVTNSSAKVGDRIALDTKTTLVAAGAFALEALRKRKKNDGEKAPVSIVDKFRLIFTDKTDSKTSDVIGDEQSFDFQHVKELLHHTDQRVREAGKQFMSRVVARWQEMAAEQSLFAFVAEGGVGIGVALLGLRLMNRELPKMPKKIQLESRFLKDRAPKNLEEREKVQRPKRSRAFHRLIPSVDKITLKRYFVKKEKRGVTVLLPVADALKRRFLKKHEARVALKEKNVRAAKPVERLWKTLHLWTRRLERLKAPSRRSVFREHTTADQKSVRESVSIRFVPFRQELRRIDLKAIEKRRQETVLQFSFAWTLWFLFRVSHFDSARGAVSTIGRNKDEKAPGQEIISEAEAPQWILLGIIWYLSMMRESGFGNNTPAGQYVSPPNPAPQYLVPQGVIFAYAPVPEHSSVRGFAHNAHIMI